MPTILPYPLVAVLQNLSRAFNTVFGNAWGNRFKFDGKINDTFRLTAFLTDSRVVVIHLLTSPGRFLLDPALHSLALPHMPIGDYLSYLRVIWQMLIQLLWPLGYVLW